MQIFGWLLFTAGAGTIYLAVFIGLSGVANIPGAILGMALLVSGSVFAGVGYIVDKLGRKSIDVVKAKSSRNSDQAHSPEEELQQVSATIARYRAAGLAVPAQLFELEEELAKAITTPTPP
jgi:hypothetical protein